MGRDSFVLGLQLGLMQRILADWPRRGEKLLEVNCGRGCFLPLLWQAGFDVMATEADRGKLALARKAAAVEFMPAHDDCLPFEDNSYAWVVLHIAPGDTERLRASTGEAMRVADRGLLCTFWNSTSLAGLARRKRPARSFWQVWRMLARGRGGRLTAFSTLAGPRCTWRDNSVLGALNSRLYWQPFGAWCAIRLDLGDPRLLTPLGLRIKPSMAVPAPAMEYSQKNMSKTS